MEVHIFSVKTKSQAGNIWVRDKMAEFSRKMGTFLQSLIVKIYPFSWKIQQKALGPGESTAGVIYLPMKIFPKHCHIFLLKVAATLLSGSRKGSVRA